jgi:D-arabinose 1-dehydrogenase-like Zn-dependent alcohol dehydrogenase
MSALIGGLRARGRMIVVGVAPDPIQLATEQLVFGTRGIDGSLTGSPLDGEETLAFSLLGGIRPMIETMPLEAAAEAYGKMMRSEARFRMVLVTGQ